MTYGYNPYRGTDQFYDCDLPYNSTSPITFWLRDNAKQEFFDVKMPDGHIIRAIYGQTVGMYVDRGGEILQD